MERLLILVNDELRADLPRIRVAELDHLREFVTGVHVQGGKRNSSGEKSLLRQAQHERRGFSNRIEHYRAREIGGGLKEKCDALGLKRTQWIEPPRRERPHLDGPSGLEFRLPD